MHPPHLAAVILNYNSERDLREIVPQILAQQSIKLALIIVDNASRHESVQSIKTWLMSWQPDTVIGTKEQVHNWVINNRDRASSPGQLFLITNHDNRGYSAGNNTGIYLADTLGSDAVLIANPDMRIDDSNYMITLYKQLIADEHNYLAASRIVDLNGNNINPLRESSFWEEWLWPLFYLGKNFGSQSYIFPANENKPSAVPKISGCCLMLRMAFLRATQYLDENTFLYCEEPILAARVCENKGRIIYVPTISAVHAHDSSEKDSTEKRMRIFINSRLYYLENYSGYSWWQLLLLKISYGMLAALHRLRGNLRK